MVATTHDSAALVPAFRRQYKLCALKPGETVVLLTDRDADRQQVAAALQAAGDLGNVVYELHFDMNLGEAFNGINPLTNKGILEALLNADLIMVFFPGFFTEWHMTIRQAGGRILMVMDTSRQLLRLQSTPELRKAAKASQARLQVTKQVRLTNEAGTDMVWDVDHEGPVFCHYGIADEPGQMDHWGQGMAASFPVEGSANGRVVVQPGDVWILPYQRLVTTPIELEVRDGFIRDIKGGLDAKMFRYFLESTQRSANDLDPFAISHLGFGLNPKARWDDIMAYNGNHDDLAASARAYPGSFLFSTGPGFKRKTKGHIDMPMNDCTVELDGDVVVDRGRLVDPAMIANPERAYH